MPESNFQDPHVRQGDQSYGHAMDNLPSRIEDEDEDHGAGAESIYRHRSRFEDKVMDGFEDGGSDSDYLAVSNLSLPARGEGMEQLTLSFQGEVYMYDAVSPDKVQAVLLLLGGYEIPSGVPSVAITSQNQMFENFPGRSSLPQRAASLSRFREKRKERCFDKKIRYSVRKEVALRMQRKKGQFTSSKPSATENSVQDEQQPETLCTHCGTSSKSTPLMRRGPAGPRTLCNACGLMWTNKGTLKYLSTSSTVETQNPSMSQIVQSTEEDDEANDSDIRNTIEAPAVLSSNGDNDTLAVTA